MMEIVYYACIVSLWMMLLGSLTVVLIDLSSCIWPKVNIQLEYAEVDELRTNTNRPEIYYQLKVKYHYIYRSKLHTSSRLNTLNSAIHTRRSKLDRYVNLARSGCVQARVFPFYPHFSLLLPGSYNKVLIGSVIAISSSIIL